ncbi:MAG: hypothetical protein R3E48_08615 [Burkholderiaceae bacterium]
MKTASFSSSMSLGSFVRVALQLVMLVGLAGCAAMIDFRNAQDCQRTGCDRAKTNELKARLDAERRENEDLRDQLRSAEADAKRIGGDLERLDRQLRTAKKRRSPELVRLQGEVAAAKRENASARRDLERAKREGDPERLAKAKAKLQALENEYQHLEQAAVQAVQN